MRLSLTAAIVAGSMLLAPSAESAPLSKAKSQAIAKIESLKMTPVEVKCQAAGRDGQSRVDCRWKATKADGSRCRGNALAARGKLRLTRVRCSLKAATLDATNAVRAAIISQGKEPGAIQCTTASSGWICGWEAFETIAGWRYRCAGEARAGTAAGPYSLAPCQLHAPDLAPLTETPGPHPPFGFNDNWGNLIGVVPWLEFSTEPVLGAASIGADTLRYELSWATVEPEPGVRHWASWDLTYSTMVAAGVKPLIVISGAPCWAAESCTGPYSQVPSAAHEGDWREFAADVAERYPLARALEVGNEPNWTTAGGANPERYARILALAYAGIKASVPSMPVLSAGLAPFTQDSRPGELSPVTFLRRAYAAGGITDSSDGVAYHAYPGTDADGDFLGGMRSQVADLREVMVGAGDAAKPIWITETGVSSAEGFTAAQQATASAAIYEQFRRIPGIAAVIFHSWSDQPGASYWENTGIVTVDGTHKPVFCALAAARGRPC